MSADQRNAMLRTVFDHVEVGEAGRLELFPVEGWRPFLKSCLPHPRRVPNERKTGLEPAKSTRRVSMNATGRIQIRAA